MPYKFLFFVVIFCSFSTLQAQEYRWSVGMDYFFDNQEYKKSTFAEPQTMNGIWLKPLGGIRWNAANTIYAGVNLLTIPGMKNREYEVDLSIYYQHETEKMLFRAGAFPRRETLPNYSEFFFRDSVNNFMPVMQGLFWQMGQGRNFINVWMDWTGYATAVARESFYVGFSGKASRGLFLGDFQAYMYHYAGTNPGNPLYGVIEQLLGSASVGVEYEDEESFKWLLSAGVLAGLERDRKADVSYMPLGFTARAHAEYWGIGTENTLYVGDPRMRFSRVYGGDLYWGTPFLQGRSYLQSKWFIRLLDLDRVTARMNCNLHLSEGEWHLQQTLSVSASIDNFSKPGRKRPLYPWKRLFQ